jgi:hypothetical protein
MAFRDPRKYSGLLCIALRPAINEWPQTVWRPVEHCLGFVCQGFGPRIIGKLVGIVSWCFDYHAATLQKNFGRSISLNPSETNGGRRGGGPREFLYVSLIVSSYFVMYWVSVQKWTLRTIPQIGREKDVPIPKVVFSTFVVNANYGRWGIGTVLLASTAPRPGKFFGMGFSTDPIPCFSRE